MGNELERSDVLKQCADLARVGVCRRSPRPCEPRLLLQDFYFVIDVDDEGSVDAIVHADGPARAFAAAFTVEG